MTSTEDAAGSGGEGHLIVLCGKPFAGKSRLAGVIAAERLTTVISLDMINEERGLWGGSGISIEDWQRTHDQARIVAERHLLAGDVVVLDDTSSRRFLRDRWRDLASSTGAGFTLVHVVVSDDEMRRRLRANRRSRVRGDVHDDVVEEFLISFEPPGQSEPHLAVNGSDDLLAWTQRMLGGDLR